MKKTQWVSNTIILKPKWGDTGDGRNPAPVHMENLPLFTKFYTSHVIFGGFRPSTVSYQTHGCLINVVWPKDATLEPRTFLLVHHPGPLPRLPLAIRLFLKGLNEAPKGPTQRPNPRGARRPLEGWMAGCLQRR